MSQEFNSALDILFRKAEDFVSTKTVVGDAITIGDITLLPLIEVSVGLGTGTAKKDSAAGGGMGAKITPSAVLVIQGGSVQLVNIKNQDAVNKLIDMAPGVLSKLDFGGIFRREAPNAEKTVRFEEEIVTEE